MDSLLLEHRDLWALENVFPLPGPTLGAAIISQFGRPDEGFHMPTIAHPWNLGSPTPHPTPVKPTPVPGSVRGLSPEDAIPGFHILSFNSRRAFFLIPASSSFSKTPSLPANPIFYLHLLIYEPSKFPSGSESSSQKSRNSSSLPHAPTHTCLMAYV